MSLVNQMLQDLERRRTEEAGLSPLGGLSASGAAVTAPQTINYLLLGMVLMLVFAVVFVLIYLFGVKQPVWDESKFTNSSAELMAKVKPLPVTAKSMQPVVEQKKASRVVPSIQAEVPLKSVVTAQVTTQVSKQIQVEEPEKAKSKNTGLKATQVASVALPIAKDVTENANSVSIVESTTESRSAPSTAASPASSMDSLDNLSGSPSVNKTVRPLTSEQQARMAFQSAVKLVGRGDQLGAQQALEKALSFEPIHIQARETLAALLLNTGRISEAGDSLREGLRLQPTATPLAKLYARVLVNQGDNTSAVAVMERAAPRVAEDPEFYALLATLYRSAGKHAQAAQVYQKLLQQRSGVAAWWMGLALSQDAMGASTESLEAYRRAQRAGGLTPEVLQYVQARIAALTPMVAKPIVSDDGIGFED